MPSDEKIMFRDYGDSNGDLVLMCGFRLFINGVDVSDHVIGSVAWSYGARGTENTCSFTLDNNNNKFVLRPSNLGLAERQGGSRSFADAESFSTSEPWKITTLNPTGEQAHFISSQQAESQGLTTYSESAKRDLYLSKLRKRVRLETTNKDNFALRSNTDPETGTVSETQYADISLYEGLFHTQAQVINILDQVRLYVLDPNRDPVLASESLWFPAFTGFVMSAPPEHDYSTGQSSISVTCSDIRTLLKRKRVLVNSASADQITPSISHDNGLFKDVILQNSNTSNAFADSSLTFEKLVALALMGVRFQDGSYTKKLDKFSDYCLKYKQSTDDEQWNTLRKTLQESNPENKRFNKNGFGGLWFGYYYMYDTSLSEDIGASKSNEKREAFMNAWNRLTTFGIDQQYLTWTEMVLQGQGTCVGGPFSALNAYVHMLVPSGGAEVSNLMDKQFIDQMGVQREYMSVGEVLEQVCERIDYQFTVTGSGDIVFEFPMYDFRPQDMGPEFRAVYAVSDSVTSDSINDEANSNPITALKVSGGLTDQLNSVGGVDEHVKAYKYTLIITHTHLSNRYGYNEEEYLIPFVTNGPNNQQSDQDYQRTLALFGCFEFLKRLTEMSSLTMNACYNPFARPNRPYYYNFGRRLSITESVQNTMSLFQNAATTVDSKYVRRIHDLTGQVIAFGASMSGTSGNLNGSSALPLNYSNKNTIDAFFDNEKYLNFLQDLYNSGIDVRVPTSAGSQGDAGTGFTSLLASSETQHVCGWSSDAKAAFDAMCARHGIPAKNMLSVMSNESRMNTLAVNTDITKSQAGTSQSTYTVGLCQMMPVNVIETLKKHPELQAKYRVHGDPNDPSTDLMNSRYSKPLRNGKGTYTPKSISQNATDTDFSNKNAFAQAFLRCFSTPQSQIELYDYFLQDSTRSNGLPSDYKIDTLEKLAMYQTATGQVRNLNNQSKIPKIDLDRYNAYLKQVTQRLDAAAKLYTAMSGGCSDTTPSTQPTSNDQTQTETFQTNKATIMSAAGTGAVAPAVSSRTSVMGPVNETPLGSSNSFASSVVIVQPQNSAPAQKPLTDYTKMLPTNLTGGKL